MARTSQDKPYLRITESRKGEGDKFERSSIHVFPEDAKEFAKAVQEDDRQVRVKKVNDQKKSPSTRMCSVTFFTAQITYPLGCPVTYPVGPDRLCSILGHRTLALSAGELAWLRHLRSTHFSPVTWLKKSSTQAPSPGQAVGLIPLVFTV